MMLVNEKGHLAAIVTKMVPDPHAGFVSCARIFSGKMKQGDEVLARHHQSQTDLSEIMAFLLVAAALGQGAPLIGAGNESEEVRGIKKQRITCKRVALL